MVKYKGDPLWGTSKRSETKMGSGPPPGCPVSGRPDKVSIGSGLPLSRKLSQLHPQQVTEFCRFKKLGKDVAEFEVPNSFAMLSFMRRRVYEFARSMPFTQEELQDIMLAVGEASTNAMKYGCNNSQCSVRIRIERHSDSLHVFILDDGTSFGNEDWVPVHSGSLDESGRGIGCMRAVMDEVMFHAQDNGTCVELVKHLSASS